MEERKEYMHGFSSPAVEFFNEKMRRFRIAPTKIFVSHGLFDELFDSGRLSSNTTAGLSGPKWFLDGNIEVFVDETLRNYDFRSCPG